MADTLSALKEKAGAMFGRVTPPEQEAEQPKTADPYQDTEAILALVNRRREEWGARGLREPFLRSAYRNILFYRGHHWVRWERTSGRWRPANVPRDIPTPVTNVFADTMDAVMSVFGRIEPKLTFSPGNADEPEDQAAADVARRMIQVAEKEVDIRVNRQSLATWVGLTGGCFLETGYDPDPIHGVRAIAIETCPGCGATQPPGGIACEACGAPGPLEPGTQPVPVGKLFVKPRSLFECYFDPSVPDWSKHRRLLTEEAVAVEDAEARWPAFTGQFTPNVVGSSEEWYMASLATQGPALDDRGTGRRDQYSPSLLNNRVTERWYWQLPDATYPEGLLAIVVGPSTVVYAKPLPYTKRTAYGSTPFLPFVWFPFHMVPGTLWPKTVADDVALKQAQRNRWESAIELCGMRMGMPIWLRPRGSNATNLTGTAGQIVDYNAMGPSNAKPERIQGQGLPLSFMQFIELIDKSIEKLAKTFDVIKGARPEGVSAGIALQILQERGMSAYGRLFIQWETSWGEWGLQATEIARQYWTEPRILQIQGRDGAWQVQKFLGADLQGRVDVIAEAGSSMPHSSLVDRAETEQLLAMGVLNGQDPEVQFEILKLYGKTNWLPSMARDTKNAIMEDEAFAQIAAHPVWAHVPPEEAQGFVAAPDYLTAVTLMRQWEQVMGLPPFPWPEISPALDGHAIHSREHKNFGKSESFRGFHKVVQAMFEKKVAAHDQLLIQQMAAIQGGGQIQGGFMQPAPGGAMPREQTLNTSSSPARLGGDYNEMERDQMAGMGGP